MKTTSNKNILGDKKSFIKPVDSAKQEEQIDEEVNLKASQSDDSEDELDEEEEDERNEEG